MSFDKYGVGQDPDCYPGTEVLKNLLDLRNDEDLGEAERYLSEVAAERLEFVEPPYSLETLKYIHRTLFSDTYDWAGKIRTVKISKGKSQFCLPDRIEPEAAKEFRKMEHVGWFEGYPRDKLVTAVAESYGMLNVVHPFREGNGRTQRILFEWIIVNTGYEINWWVVDQQEWIEANIRSYHGDDGHLVQVFDRCIGLPIQVAIDP
ncbi:Fic/DOC family protein [Azotobacter vinelandii]|uniref:Fic/DOC family protein n=1 Tax=Azotobacter vinelandii TaxID=354 RepID=UPI00091BF123|nr:Fic family protein [Azotobacter vinelandii]WKN23104.1 Fic family protein [Azotobacter vinelandii]SFY31995.1 cell filamentation protein [Azotobacter vinelandii]